MTDQREPLTYAAAGVNIAAGTRAVQLIAGHVRSTFRPEVLGDIGFLGGLFRLGGTYREPVLASSTDGVGTKLKIAIALDRHHVFNMGLGMVVACAADHVAVVRSVAPEALVVGEVIAQSGDERVALA